MRKIVFIILFLSLSIFIGFYFDYRKDSVVEQYLQEKSNQLNRTCSLLYRDYKTLSHMIFDTTVNTDSVINIFKNAYKSDDNNKEQIREKLYDLLKEDYELLRHYDIRQLHFHLPDNRSFLRFHRPKIFGDDLSAVRPTVVYVNEYKKPIDGYEEGRIFSGYRFVYPLFADHQEYIGSVEISFNMMIMIKEIIDNLNLSSNFLIAKSVVDEKIFQGEESNVIPSAFDDYYFEKEIFDKVKKSLGIKEHKSISDASKQIFYNHIGKGEPFSFYDEKSFDILTFIPIKNPLTDKVIGSIVIRSDSAYIQKRTREFYWLSASLIVLVTLILYVIYREIQLKEKLKLNNHKLQTVIEEADSGIGVMDLEGNFLEVNQVYCDLLGYTKEELLHLSCVELTKGDDTELSQYILATAKKEGKISKVKKTCIRKDGSEIYLELSLTMLPSKEAFAAVINSLENTRRLEELNQTLIQKQREIKKQKEAFETLYEKSADGVLLIEGEKFIDCNEAILKMTGYHSKTEFLNRHPSEFSPAFQPDGTPSFEKANQMIDIAYQEGVNHFEWMHTKASGENFWAEVVLTHIQLDEKDVIHVVWRDISERKKLEADLRMLNKNLWQKVNEEVKKNREKEKTMLHQSRLAQMGEMISMIAHQWRQPLSAISATSADLGMKILLNNFEKKLFQEKLKNISEYSQHLSKTIDDFRDFYKSNKEKRTITLEHIFESALNIIEISIKNKNITIIKGFTCNDTIQTYPNELKQVVLNLIKNAEDALLENKIAEPRIELKTEKIDDYVYLSVSDNAGGVAEDIIDKIFEPYFTTKQKRDGTGLGLYMSKTIIEDHCQGLLSVENFNDGARFTIKLPLDFEDKI